MLRKPVKSTHEREFLFICFRSFGEWKQNLWWKVCSILTTLGKNGVFPASSCRDFEYWHIVTQVTLSSTCDGYQIGVSGSYFVNKFINLHGVQWKMFELCLVPSAKTGKLSGIFNIRLVNRNMKSNQVNILVYQGISEELFWVQEVGQCQVDLIQFLFINK